MNAREKTVSTIDTLLAASEDKSIRHIAIHGNLNGATPERSALLPPVFRTIPARRG
jgi:hypothetical protein